MKLSQEHTDRIVAALARIAGEVGNTEPWRDAEWLAFDRIARPLEDRFTRKAFRAFIAIGDVAVTTLRRTAEGDTAHEDMIVGAAQSVSLALFQKIGEEEIPVSLAGGWRYGTRQIEAALAAGRRAAGGFSVKLANPFDVNWPEVGMYILYRPRRYSQAVTETTITGFRTILTRLFNEGAGIEPMAREIRDHFDEIALPRARMIARTETISASNLGAHNSYQASNVVTGRIWLCVTGNTRVSGPGVTHLARRWHAGRIIELRTASGRVLTVTGEHPILTRRGWIAAEHVHKGDDLIRYTRSVERTPPLTWGVPDVDDMPPPIEEIFCSLMQPRARGGTMARVVNLDREGRKSEVDVILADAELSDWLQPSRDERVRQILLELSDRRLGALFTNRALGEHRGWDRRPSDPAYEVARLCSCGVGVSADAHEAGIRARAHRDASDAQTFRDAGGGTSVLKREHPYGVPAAIVRGDRRSDGVEIQPPPRRDLATHQDTDGMLIGARIGGIPDHAGFGSRTDVNTGPHQAFHDGSRSTGVLTGQMVGRTPREIPFDYDRCVSVKIMAGGCHVYDITTQGGWIIANGLVIHNSTRDDRTRDTHRKADGQERDIDDPFVVGGARMMYPGDTTRGAPIREWIQCRCAISPRVKKLPGT